MNEIVSVLMATYNRADFIEAAVRSVLEQTYQNWELIIIDDGSTDNTKSVLKPFLDADNIQYVYQDNTGQSGALNRGLQLSRGKYIAFIDSDNIWLPGRLEKTLQAAQDYPGCGVVFGDVITIDCKGNVTSRDNMCRYGGHITQMLFRDNFVTFNTTLVRRELLKRIHGFNADVKRAPDYDLWLRLSTITEFKYIPVELVQYRVMAGQISSNKDARFRNNYETLTRFRKHFPDAVSFYSWHRGLSSYYVRKARYQMDVGQKGPALTDTLLAILHMPAWQGPWRVLIKLLVQ